MTGSIYVLVEPGGEIRYVGWTTTRLDRRLSGHRGERGGSPKVRWLRRLVALGLAPRIELVQEVPVEDGPAAERYWIEHFRERGCDLLNSVAPPRVGIVPRGKGLVPMTFYLTDETRDHLTRLAEADGRTLGEYVRIIITRRLRERC